GRSSRTRWSSPRALTRPAVCRSWPTACIFPEVAAKSNPVASVTGSPSISPRRSTAGTTPVEPFFREPPRSTTTIEDSPCPVLTSTSRPSMASRTSFCVTGRSRPTSTFSCRARRRVTSPGAMSAASSAVGRWVGVAAAEAVGSSGSELMLPSLWLLSSAHLCPTAVRTVPRVREVLGDPLDPGAQRRALPFGDDEGHRQVRIMGDRQVDVRPADPLEVLEHEPAQPEGRGTGSGRNHLGGLPGQPAGEADRLLQRLLR